MVQENRDTQFLVRCTFELRESAEYLAKEKGQSLVEWVRRAIKTEVERQMAEEGLYKRKIPAVLPRDYQPAANLSPDAADLPPHEDLKKVMREVILEMKKSGEL